MTKIFINEVDGEAVQTIHVGSPEDGDLPESLRELARDAAKTGHAEMDGEDGIRLVAAREENA